ncbi:MAG: hypothetical protein KKA22_12125 [Gammaproteobacteria bacterium]|nr:hypothetical protein [Gammaproteobacteria bacterium]MBU1408884.1 hypothetical protein [Gammaproteobacteria bacterium]MBU1532721.1 hypothetical protein [Gammaproteobacteria bacterium]
MSENLAYALTQVAHNFGAAAVLGGAVFALWPVLRLEYGRSFAWLILIGWGAQIASGAVFGLTSFYYYGEMPDLSRVAMAALAVKVAAAIVGFLLAAFYLARGREWDRVRVKHTFQALAALAAAALTAAAFLRWFS